jgi:ribosomal protein L37AE/L43A
MSFRDEMPSDRPACPKCGSTDIRRSKSEGLLAAVAQMFGRWPFRCRSCRVRFYRAAEAPHDDHDAGPVE